jgi:hypothetical protein
VGEIRLDETGFATVVCPAHSCSLDVMQSLYQHGDLNAEAVPEVRRVKGCASMIAQPPCHSHSIQRFEIELRVMVEMIPFNEAASGFQAQKRMPLYKHDDELRQELFAIEFVKTCDVLLKASGPDLSVLTFRCILVSARQGFIECVPGSVPLSDICKPPDDVAHSRIFSTESNVERVHQSQSPVSGKVPVSVSHGTCTNYCRTRSCFQQSHRGLFMECRVLSRCTIF